MQKWKTEVILLSEEGEELDWFDANPGPAMRGWLQGHRTKMGSGFSAKLQITHLASNRARRLDVFPTGKIGFMAKVNDGLETLEAAANILKEELEALHEQEQQINEKG